MPFINVEIGQASKEQKAQLIGGITQVASEVLGIKPEHFYVLVKENSADNWGVGGEMLSDRFATNPDL